MRQGRVEPGDGDRGALWWRFDEPRPAVSSGSVGGGLRRVGWVLNIGVERDYRRTDLDEHAAQVQRRVGLLGPGTALFTAVPPALVVTGVEHGVQAWSTVGVTRPTWPADRSDVDATSAAPVVGTINTVVVVPVALEQAALVQSALTATEAKAQACIEAGVAGTGTASDAVVVVAEATGPQERFGGVRSVWGARVALAVHEAVTSGLRMVT